MFLPATRQSCPQNDFTKDNNKMISLRIITDLSHSHRRLLIFLICMWYFCATLKIQVIVYHSEDSSPENEKKKKSKKQTNKQKNNNTHLLKSKKIFDKVPIWQSFTQ